MALSAIAAVLILVGIAAPKAPIRRFLAGSDDASAADWRRIAVTSFVARGDATGGGLSDFAAALTEQLVLELNGVNALTVIALTESPACAPGGVSCDTILRRRRVGAVTRGSVERVQNAYHVSIQLIDVTTGAAAHSDRFEAPDSNRLAAEHELAARIAQSVRRWLGREARFAALMKGSPVPRARDLMLQAERTREDALAIAEQPAKEDLPTAFAAFDRADSLVNLARRADPNWLEPLLVLGWNAYNVSRLQSGAARMASLRRGLAFADTAFAVDSASAVVLELRGALRWGVVSELDPRTDTMLVRNAESDLRGAVARDSSRAVAWQTLSFLLSVRGAFAEAELAGRRALAQDAFLDGARATIYRAFFNAAKIPDLKAAARWCAYGRQTRPNDWLFLQCELILMRRDASARPDADSAWRLVAAMDRLDPPEKAAAAGRAYFAIFRRMVAATISARAGHSEVARAEIARAHRATAGNKELQLDLLYDESILRNVLGERETAARMIQKLIDARPLERQTILRDPLFAWLAEDPKRRR